MLVSLDLNSSFPKSGKICKLIIKHISLLFYIIKKIIVMGALSINPISPVTSQFFPCKRRN